MISAVVCDFGGVLTSPLAASFESFAKRSGITLAALGAALATLAARDGVHPLHELECGRVSEASFLEAMGEALSEQLGREIAMASFAEDYFAGLEPNASMIELMATLRGEGYRMALLTNNVREWETRWRAMAPIEEIFELVVDSAFVGMRKPEPEIYELALQRLALPAAQCLFVDDFEDNCQAARAAGMTAVVYREPQQAIGEIRTALSGEAQLSEPKRSQR